MMELCEVTKIYQQGRRTVQAVRGVNLRIVGGEFVVIMGPSGSGKSTLMHLLGALDTPTTGRNLFNDRDLQTMSDKERSLLRRNRICFIDRATRDPDVVAIKICLYRTGSESPIPESLIEASARGKQVTALVELQARFDEENNIEWAKRLEESGVHVVYGIVGLKTHCKVALVVRQEGEQLRRYVHVATGNYNPVTSNFYTDLGLFTSEEAVGEDATDLFNFLTGYSRQKE